jgi:hypothetical protein
MFSLLQNSVSDVSLKMSDNYKRKHRNDLNRTIYLIKSTIKKERNSPTQTYEKGAFLVPEFSSAI